MATEEIIIEDNQLVCVLTDKPKKATSQEKNIQSVILMLNEEYGFDLKNIARDVNIVFTDPDTGKTKKQKIEIGKASILNKGSKVAILSNGFIGRNVVFAFAEISNSELFSLLSLIKFLNPSLSDGIASL